MEVGPSSQSMEKEYLPWSDFMVHGVNWLLGVVYISDHKGALSMVTLYGNTSMVYKVRS